MSTMSTSTSLPFGFPIAPLFALDTLWFIVLRRLGI